MITKSRKAKGRALQNLVVEKVLSSFPSLEKDDVKGAIMGERGVDIKLSPKAKKVFPFNVECKNQERFKNVYDCFAQADQNGNGEPIVVLKMNRRKPVVVLDCDFFFSLIQEKDTKYG
jgi:hypothetical protein|tara:strand:+ start:29 stop:382 length:354 start_codon:yes stop_codon:yes gene_type:complete